ncbi:MAG: GNAT family N-acetyltransferase [Burkholderiales bacterium]|nr:GNAT family N-acetyltransferase [Burkholderiales bacterium]
MRVRTADQRDIPLLLTLYRHLNSEDPAIFPDVACENLEVLKRYPGSDIFTGFLGDDLVSTCALVVIPNFTRGGAPYALIENVVTDPAHRNKGYGKAVLKAATEQAWRVGCYKVMLLTGSKRPSTLKFYQDAGFEQNKTGFQMRRKPQ